MVGRWRLPGLLTLAGLVVAVAGCTGGPQSPSTAASPTARGLQTIGTVTITESDCTFTPTDSGLASGVARLIVDNQTDGLAGVHLWRIADGRGFGDLASWIAEEVALAEAGKPGLGPPDFVADLIPLEVDAGETQSINGTLRAGTYGMVCARFFDSLQQMRPVDALGPIDVR